MAMFNGYVSLPEGMGMIKVNLIVIFPNESWKKIIHQTACLKDIPILPTHHRHCIIHVYIEIDLDLDIDIDIDIHVYIYIYVYIFIHTYARITMYCPYITTSHRHIKFILHPPQQWPQAPSQPAKWSIQFFWKKNCTCLFKSGLV